MEAKTIENFEQHTKGTGEMKLQGTKVVFSEGSVSFRRVDFPLSINGHSVVCAKNDELRKYVCACCDESVGFSQTVWEHSTDENREDAELFVFGHFYKNSCDSYKKLKDVVKGGVSQYVGELSSPVIRRKIKKEITSGLLNEH